MSCGVGPQAWAIDAFVKPINDPDGSDGGAPGARDAGPLRRGARRTGPRA